MATAFFGPAKQKAPVESSGSVPHVGLAGQSPLPIPGHAYLSAYGLKPQAESYFPFGIKSDNPLRDRASFASVDKIDYTTLSHHPLEDDDEYENDWGL
jgi:hypothetical protein